MQEQAGITRKLPRSGLVQPWFIGNNLGVAGVELVADIGKSGDYR